MAKKLEQNEARWASEVAPTASDRTLREALKRAQRVEKEARAKRTGELHQFVANAGRTRRIKRGGSRG